MNLLKPLCRLAAISALAFAPLAAQATLIGDWTFGGSTPLADSTGHFGNLELHGNASVANGQLVVTGSGTTATGWARATSYSGPTITDKTLVVWASLQGLANTAYAGSVMTIDRINADQFDGIIFGERQTNKWMNGSSNFNRTQDFNPGAAETTVNQMIQLAFTYDVLNNGNVVITGYRNGTLIGSYTSGNAASWSTGNTEILFGIRHIASNMSGPGGLNATISEARLYDTVLSQSDIQGLNIASVPEPTGLALLGTAGLLALIRRRKNLV